MREEFREIGEDLAESDKMTYDPMSRVVHELRTPLVAVKTCIELLRDREGACVKLRLGYHSFPLTAFAQMGGMFAPLRSAQPSALMSFRTLQELDMTNPYLSRPPVNAHFVRYRPDGILSLNNFGFSGSFLWT